MNAAGADTDELDLGRVDEFAGFHLRIAQLRHFAQFPATGNMAGITPALFSALLLIEANPGVKQTTLASVLQVDRSTIVRMIDRLEDRGLVRRGSSRQDRRVAPPTLTARGRMFVSDAVRRVHRADDISLQRLSERERLALLELLRKANGLD